jgi:hypothetical protein
MLRFASKIKWTKFFKNIKYPQSLRLAPYSQFAFNKVKFGFSFIKNMQL